MTKILCVHGRGQEDKDEGARQAMARHWVGGLAKGLVEAGYAPVDVNATIFPYYGQELWDALQARIRQGNKPFTLESLTYEPGEDVEPIAERTGSLIEEVAADAGYRPEPHTPEELNDVLDVPGVSPALNWLASKLRVDRLLITQVLRDVALYLEGGAIRDRVLSVVRESVAEASVTSGEPLIVIGHSLGSVVVYDLLTSGALDNEVPLLITAGSPLGLRTVKKNLVQPIADGARGPRPPRVTRWVNTYDSQDIVATGAPLSAGHYDDVKDERTFNPSGAHSIADYLSDPDVAQCVGEALAQQRA